MYKCFASTQQQSRFYNIHLLPRPFTQMPARETLSLHYRLYAFPKSTRSLFHQMFTKTPDSQCCLVSLSLQFLCSSLTDYQAQRKVLAFGQAILANRASHCYVHKDRLFCFPNLSRLVDHPPPRFLELPKSSPDFR